MIKIVAKVQSKILRPVYKKVLFNILHHSFQILLQSLQKVLIRPHKNMLEKKNKFASKMQNSMLISDMLEVSPQKAGEKVLSKIVVFLPVSTHILVFFVANCLLASVLLLSCQLLKFSCCSL